MRFCPNKFDYIKQICLSRPLFLVPVKNSEGVADLKIVVWSCEEINYIGKKVVIKLVRSSQRCFCIPRIMNKLRQKGYVHLLGINRTALIS